MARGLLERTSRTGRTGRCLVCGSRQVDSRQLAFFRRPGKVYDIEVCPRCGYVANRGNSRDYASFTSVKQFALTPRVGTLERPGREYHMARMGAKILKSSAPLRVMVFSAGRSLDYRHIEKLPSVNRVVMSDVVDLHDHDHDDFVNILHGTDERFDLIIACEVVEHFLDPAAEFPRLFDLLSKRGLLVCSTNIYDGGDLERQNYLYIPGHTSYYSPRTIARIARYNGMYFDFRLPTIATAEAGPRKRYVFLTRSVGRLQDIAQYFGSHPYAPAEAPD